MSFADQIRINVINKMYENEVERTVGTSYME